MRRSIATLLCVLGLGSLLLAASPASAEPDAQTTVWVYTIRLVRVDTTTPEIVEKAPSWQAEGKPTTDLAWKDLLQSLKERGKTTVVLDQQATALPDTEVLVKDTRDRQIEQLQRRDRNNETFQSSTLSAGSMVKLRNNGGVFKYDAEVKWELPRRAADMRPLLGTASWHGSYPAQSGRTLVLTHRKQVAYEDREPRGIEFYVFITGRLLATD